MKKVPSPVIPAHVDQRTSERVSAAETVIIAVEHGFRGAEEFSLEEWKHAEPIPDVEKRRRDTMTALLRAVQAGRSAAEEAIVRFEKPFDFCLSDDFNAIFKEAIQRHFELDRPELRSVSACIEAAARSGFLERLEQMRIAMPNDVGGNA